MNWIEDNSIRSHAETPEPWKVVVSACRDYYVWYVFGVGNGASHPGWAEFRKDEIVHFDIKVIGHTKTIESARTNAEQAYQTLCNVVES